MPAKILIADDDAPMRILYSRMFNGRGYDISMASSYTEAAGLIAAGDYDLLITDFMFDDGVGTGLISLFQKKKGRKARRAPRSLLVTGYPAAPGRDSCPEVAGYFEKPFRVGDFLKAVETALAA